MIYTSYFAMLKRIPADTIVPISICGKAPDWYKGLQYKVLAPRYDFFQEWKKNKDNQYYTECYNNQILSHMNPSDIEKVLYSMSRGKDVVLLCYEKPSDFCHRHLVADWFCNHGIQVEEFKT